MTTTRLSRDELQAAFMNLSVAEVREIHDHIATFGGSLCVFIELEDPHTSEAGSVVLSSGRRVWLYATNDGVEENPVSMLVIWNGADCLSVRR